MHVCVRLGVVFHYRDSLGRYAFSFQQAHRACEAIGAQTATPDQLLAAYYDGYEQCDAGWLADQSVRYFCQLCVLLRIQNCVLDCCLFCLYNLWYNLHSYIHTDYVFFFRCRYPIQVPREACYGDMDGHPGVRNYGTMDADDLFDVYCYIEHNDGMNQNTRAMSFTKC